MIDKPTEPIQGGPDGSIEVTNEVRRRELELELIKIRSEAAAARLDAKAAELELTIRRLSRSAQTDSHSSRVDAPEVHQPTQRSTTADLIASSSAPVEFDPTRAATAQPAAVTAETADNDLVAPAFSSWDAVRSATSAQPTSPQNWPAVATGAESAIAINRIDAGSADIKAPKFSHEPVTTASSPNDQWDTVAPEDLRLRQSAATQDVAPLADSASEAVSTPQPFVLATADSGADKVDVGPVAIAADADDEQSQRRRSPAALLISTVVHVLILVALAALTLSAHDPKDQIALAASVSEPSEQAMETFQIETSQPESKPTEPTPSEAEYDLSSVGEVAVTDFQPDATPAPPAPSTSSMLSAPMSAAAMSLQSDADAKIQFCGVEGGGNHFVYLVDSSGSMGDGFELARAELLSSIDVLKADQRFYVVFFDAEPDYMRVSDPKQNDSRSVFATPENKQALKRWAMRISKNTGRAPYDPLKFALQLQPDVIFLLSDGEFPQGIEDLLKARNRVENLFGDSGPISIVHTIGYHSREGESRMRRIAEQNQGQYRHVPKP